MSENKKITITDVARLAGVSKGTVDRVIHNRGEVSKKSHAKVMEVIRQLDYRPNAYASLLASNRRYRFACLIPAYAPGEFWEIVDSGICRAYEEYRDLNIHIDTIYYNQFDVAEFDRGCREILDNPPDAVMIAPMFREEAAKFCEGLAASGVPFVFVESKLDDTPYTAYYGMPVFESGVLSARLLLKGGGWVASDEVASDGEVAGGGVKKVACFRMRRGGDLLSNTASGRLEGFNDYVRKNNPGCEVLLEYLQPRTCDENIRVLDRLFAQHPDLDHMVTFNSRAFIICDYLRLRGLKGKTVLGFDPLEDNVKGMKDGYLEYIIAQKGMTQAYEGIKALCNTFVFKNRPETRDNYMSMDILTAENVDYYTDLR